jgi:methyl-accepting chemotaxis protein
MRDTIRDVVNALVPSFVRQRYTVKFVVSILLVVVVIGSVGAYGYTEARETVRDDTRQQLETRAEIQADAVSTFVRNKRIQTLTVSNAERAQDDARDKTYVDLKYKDVQAAAGGSASAGTISDIHILDLASGTVVVSTNSDLEGQPLDGIDATWAGTSVFDAYGTNQVWRADQTHTSASTGERVLAFASPTPNEERVVVIEGPISTGSGRGMGGSQQTALVTADGQLVGGSGYQAAGFASADQPGQLADLVVGGGTTRVAIRGDRIFAVAPVAGTDWVAVTSTTEAAAFAVSQSVGQTIGLVIVSGLVALVVVGAVLGQQTVTPLTRLRRAVERMEQGDLDVDLETRRSDEVGQLYAGFASMRDSLRRQIRQTQETNRHLEQKADEYSDVMRQCADGDLTRRMDPESDNEAMANIAAEFNEMMDELEATTANIKDFASRVAISSREVTASADEVLSASEQVSESVEEISEGAERQEESLTTVNTEVDSLSETIDDIADSSNEVAELASETVATGRDGQQAAQAAIDDIDRVTEESEAAVEEIRRLEAETEQIDELIEFIGEIARRTNMLALNANIEATRSESGADDGFGVIANEIKQLSEEAQEATEDIESRLERIADQTGAAADVVEGTREQVAAAAGNVREAVDALEEVTEYAAETNDGVQSISAANREQVETTRQVADRVEDVAAISSRTAQESETVAALAQEQTVAVTQVSESAGDLSDRAERLSDSLDDFATATEATPDTGRTAEPGDGPAGAGGTAAFDPGDDAETPDEPAAFSPDPAEDGADDGGDDDGPAFQAMPESEDD